MGLQLTTTLAYLLFLIGGLWLPGRMLGYALQLPVALGGAVVGSAAILLNLLLVFDAIGIPFTLSHVSCGLGAVSLILVAVGRRRNNTITPPATLGFTFSSPSWFMLPAGLGLAAIAIRATMDPLSGFDTPFRWDFLAQRMYHTGNLSFYPASEPVDFLHYAWCDGIAPLVSSMYLWAYLSLGHVAPWATAPIVILQGVLLFTTVGALAQPSTHSMAGALVASSSVFLWGVAMGQETGLTALTLCLMFLYLDRHRDDPCQGWVIWAGIAAGTGALAREYTLIYPILGVIALRWKNSPRQDYVRFLACAILIALPWYVRNWVKTGNPLWAHELGGLFPGNAVQTAYYRAVGEIHAFTANPGLVDTLGLLLVTLMMLPLVPGLIAGVSDWRRSAPKLVAIASIFTLWLWSISQTSGGPVYSLRVLTPALALCSALGAGFITRLLTPRGRLLAVGLLTLTAFDAAVRSFYLPIDPYVRWWREPVTGWQDFSRHAAKWRNQPQWTSIAQVAGPQLILVSDPLCHAILTNRGAHVVPFYSPQVRFLFESDADFEVGLAQLRALGFRFIVLTRHNNFLDRQLAPHRFFQLLVQQTPVLSESLYSVYDLYSPSSHASGNIR